MQTGKAVPEVKAFLGHDNMNSVLPHPGPSMSSSSWVLSSGISLKKIHFLLRGYIRSGNISSQSSQPGLAQKCALNKASSHHAYHQCQQHHCDEHKSIFTSILGDFLTDDDLQHLRESAVKFA